MVEVRTRKRCACGCGEMIEPLDNRGRSCKFAYHHQRGFKGHTAWNKGTKGIVKAWNKGLKGVQRHSVETRKKMSISRMGEKHWNWKGGKFIAAKGYYYKYNPNHHFATDDGYVMEHRLVWEQHYNAVLLPWADVHHINGDKLDNRVENLQAMMHGDHTILTRTIRVNII